MTRTKTCLITFGAIAVGVVISYFVARHNKEQERELEPVLSKIESLTNQDISISGYSQNNKVITVYHNKSNYTFNLRYDGLTPAEK